MNCFLSSSYEELQRKCDVVRVLIFSKKHCSYAEALERWLETFSMSEGEKKEFFNFKCESGRRKGVRLVHSQNSIAVIVANTENGRTHPGGTVWMKQGFSRCSDKVKFRHGGRPVHPPPSFACVAGLAVLLGTIRYIFVELWLTTVLAIPRDKFAFLFKILKYCMLVTCHPRIKVKGATIAPKGLHFRQL